MLDANGDGSVDQREFLVAAKECLEAQKKVEERDANRDVLDALERMSTYLVHNRVSAKRNLHVCSWVGDGDGDVGVRGGVCGWCGWVVGVDVGMGAGVGIGVCDGGCVGGLEAGWQASVCAWFWVWVQVLLKV